MENITDIIEGCKKKDRMCQETLYRKYYTSLFALCRTFFEDKQEVVTALNNGMMNVYNNIDQYNESKGLFFNWVYTVVRNSALTLLRNNKNFKKVQTLEYLEKEAQDNPFNNLKWSEIYFYLDFLPPKTRCICNLFYLQGFSIKEISVAVEAKEGTVKWHLNESRARLKPIFEQYYF